MSRVLIYVAGGVADYIADEGVEVVLYDFDCANDPEAEEWKVPAHFADLADIVEVPHD